MIGLRIILHGFWVSCTCKLVVRDLSYVLGKSKDAKHGYIKANTKAKNNIVNTLYRSRDGNREQDKKFHEEKKSIWATRNTASALNHINNNIMR